MNLKQISLLFVAAAFSVSLWAGTKTVQFNAMISGNKGTVEKSLKATKGVKSVKINTKAGIVEVNYDDSQTDINALCGVFRSAGVYASPIGENCATKPGGCLNNTPTSTNTMK